MTTIDLADPADPPGGARALPGRLDSESLRALYAAQYDPLANFAWRLTHDESAAEDIVQEAFARLAARRLFTAKPVPYLYRTVSNLAVDAWRHRQREARLGRILTSPPDTPPPDLTVYDAVSRLPKDERAVITLFYFADLPVADVAATVGKPEGTVRWLLTAARRRLAEILGDRRA